jgi:nucleoid-associated protein YgaU
MEENSPVKKRLVLTTAHDNQKSIQIDLYNSYAKTMADALYMGSLVVENLKPQPKGTPNIAMTLSANSAGQITADAVDLDSSVNGAPQHLSVSLADVAEDDRVNDEIPDFDLEPHEHPPRGLYDRESSLEPTVRNKKFPWPLLITAAALLVALGGLLYFFFFNSRGKAIRLGFRRPPTVSATITPEPSAPAASPAPALPSAQAPASAPAEPSAVAPDPAEPSAQPPAASSDQPPAVPEQPAATPLISAAEPPPRAAAGEADRTRTLPPVASYKVPQTIPREGAPYTIRWGDTLWDISEAFYRNPWLYPRIARFNAIRNPDFIIAGRTIRIPPGN